jgi:hypothetical protein
MDILHQPPRPIVFHEVMHSALSSHSESIPNFIPNTSPARTLFSQTFTGYPHHPLSYSDSYDDDCFSLCHIISEKSLR